MPTATFAMRSIFRLGVILAIAGWPALVSASHHIGTPLSQEEIAPWDIDVGPDGRSLPAGSGDVAMGAHVFASKCAACHGAEGQGLIGEALVGGRGTLASDKPKRTVGSYWPYPTTLFDYIRRAMPFDAPESLSSAEVYAVSAFLLNQNGIVAAGTTLDKDSLPKVRMPNRDGFVPDPRPGNFDGQCADRLSCICDGT